MSSYLPAGLIQESLAIFQKATAINPHNIANLKQASAWGDAHPTEASRHHLRPPELESSAGWEISVPAGEAQGGN